MLKTYLKAKSKLDFAGFLLDFSGSYPVMRYQSIVGPIQGRAAVPETVGEDGIVLEAQQAVGDPEFWYMLILNKDEVTGAETVLVCDEAEGQSVCGVA